MYGDNPWTLQIFVGHRSSLKVLYLSDGRYPSNAKRIADWAYVYW